MQRNMVAFITGAAGSLGSVTARKLASDGYKVMMVDKNEIKGSKIAESIGKNAEFFAADITSEDAVKEALDLTKNKLGNVNIIVNCAVKYRARLLYNPVRATISSQEDFETDFKNNMFGLINVIRLGAKQIHENTLDEDNLRGVIINTGGFAATEGNAGQVLLSAVWGGIASMTQPLSKELGPIGIRVMTIQPGLFSSGVTEILSKKVKSHLELSTPSPKRFGKPEEFANLVKFIIENPFMNGDVVRLDGGLRTYLL